MTTPTTTYATDEDIAIRTPADFAVLCPCHQILASGTDGVSPSTDNWLLRSNSVSFLTQGVAPGNVVQLLGPASIVGTGGDLLIVSTVSSAEIRLRRQGQAQSSGQPAFPTGGASGIQFLVTTLAPQIQVASYDLNRRFGIDENLGGRRSTDLYDPRELCEATVLSVMYSRYMDLSQGVNSPFGPKAEMVKSLLDDVCARIALHWNAGEAGQNPTTTSFGTRMAR